MPTHTYEWREMMSLFRQSRISIDHDARTIEFTDAIRSKSFFNVLPIRSVTFGFDDLEKVEAYDDPSGHRCVLIETSTAKGIFLDSDVPDFDDFEQQMIDLSPGN